MLENINYRTIIQSLSISEQMEVFGWCIGRNVSIGQTFCSFLRLDKNPGCFIREHNQLCFLTDYAYPEHSKLTCIHCVSKLMNCTLQQASVNVYAALYFNKPLQFGIQSTVGTIQKGRKSGINIHFCPWTKEGKPTYTKWDEEYWADTEVTFEDLKRNDIFSIHHFFLNDKMIMPKYPTYGYYRANTGHVKIHQTKATKEDRFLGNTNLQDIWVFNENQEKVLLTKSVKDALILSKQLPYWRIINFNNEGVLPDYPRVDLVLYDNDNAGIKAANKASEKFDAKAIFLESAKDAYDVIKQHGMKTLKKELKQLIK